MGEYADLYYRGEVLKNHGYDPGSMYSYGATKNNRRCPACGKKFKSIRAVADHLRDYHNRESE